MCAMMCDDDHNNACHTLSPHTHLTHTPPPPQSMDLCCTVQPFNRSIIKDRYLIHVRQYDKKVFLSGKLRTS